MKKISKKEAIQALSEHYEIPIQTIVGWIKAFQKLKGKQAQRRIKGPVPWQQKLETTEANAIALLGECFRVGGLGWVKPRDLETNLEERAFKEALLFAEQTHWLEKPLPASDELLITPIGLEKLRRVSQFFHLSDEEEKSL